MKMLNRRSSALVRAESTLESHVRACRSEGVAKLPTVAELCRQAGVSHVTMQVAVRDFVRRGLVRTRRGSGLFVSGVAGAQQTPPESRPAWRRLFSTIERDLLSGVYGRGTLLPLRKELAARYSASPPTLSKALHQLSARALVVREGRRYRVPSPKTTRGGGTVVVMRAGQHRGTSLPDLRHLSDLLTLENACSRAGLRAATVFYSYVGKALVPTGPFTPPPYTSRRLEDILGFVVFTRGLGQLGPVEHVRALARYRRPVAVLDEGGECAQAGGWERLPNVRVFPIGFSSDAGKRIGELLLCEGHQRVAYVDPYAGNAWSRMRLDGLRQAFLAADLPQAVEHVVVGGADEVAPYDSRGKTVAELVAVLGSRLDPADELQARIAQVLSVDKQDTMSEYVWTWILDARVGEVIRERVADLAVHTEITAVVGASDIVALHCLNQLEDMGVAVPGRKAVVGFDDSYPAQVYGLTSYDFNGSAAVQAAVDFVVQPRWPLYHDASGTGIVEVQGFVKERQTTGGARTARA